MCASKRRKMESASIAGSRAGVERMWAGWALALCAMD